MTPMKVLSVALVLGSFLTLSRAAPVNSTGLMRSSGLCAYERAHSPHNIGAFVPQCDHNGNFLPQQCWASTGYCWCVNVITGEEIPNTKTPPGTMPVSCGSEFYCPNSWTLFGEQCFIFINSMKSWAEAEGYCLFEGANLASVHSPMENHFIQALTRGDTYDFPQTWIGGYDAIYLNAWMWSDGSRFDYENWNMDYEPMPNERCLKMNYGFHKKWINASCNETLPFVCAKGI